MMMQPLTQPQDVFLAAHVDMYGPVQAARDYLIAHRREVGVVECPLAVAAIPHATATRYQAGQMRVRMTGHANAGRGWWQWLQDAWFVFCWGWRWLRKPAVFLGINNLNAAVGIVLRALGRCGSVVYYVIDYTPERFGNRLLNRCYQSLARFAARHADTVWNLSERMVGVHTKKFKADPKRQLIVPIGLDRGQIQVLPEERVEKNRLIVLSTLYENKGVQLAIAALRQLPGAHLVIAGDGPYRAALEGLAAQAGVASRVEWLGSLKHGPELFDQIARSRVAIATYVPEAGNYTYYADPSKPKEYLACGTPVVITRVPWIAQAIEEGPMGAAIEYEADALAAACRRLMQDDGYWRTCRKNALAYTRNLDWQQIFDQAWAQVKELQEAKP